MIPLKLSTIATELGAELLGEDITITGTSTDTRLIQQSDLFIALIGPNFDGHSFVADVVNKGACALLVDHPMEIDVPQLVVADTRIALGQLGAMVKRIVAPKTVAITGSSGKTTVKEMVSSIMSRLGKVLATQGNFNNDIGVPLTLLRLEQDHDFAVVELGANHLGEIAYTTQLVKPDVAIINNVAAAHLEGFGDLFGVARAKGEIFNGLGQDGISIVNADSEYSLFWQRRLYNREMMTFGLEHDADLSADNVAFDMDGCASFELSFEGNKHLIQLNVPGRHNVANAMAAAAICLSMGAKMEDIKAGLLDMSGVKGRLNIHHVSDNIRVIDDSYNANVDSAKAAIDLLATFPGRRILIMGDMAELGQQARMYHEEVGLHAKKQGLDDLLSLGVLSQSTSGVFNGKGCHFSDKGSLVSHLKSLLANDERNITILVKGSRSSKMEEVVELVKHSDLAFNVNGAQIAC